MSLREMHEQQKQSSPREQLQELNRQSRTELENSLLKEALAMSSENCEELMKQSNQEQVKQADLEGGWYEFEKDYFSSAFFEGKKIPCISLKGQKVFHSGYELRDKDKHDISILESLSK